MFNSHWKETTLWILAKMEEEVFYMYTLKIIFFGKKLLNINDLLNKYYGNSATSTFIVKKYFTEFSCCRTSFIEAECSGRQSDVA